MKAVEITEENNFLGDFEVGEIVMMEPPKYIKLKNGDLLINYKKGFLDLEVPIFDDKNKKLGKIIKQGDKYTFEIKDK